ncbi:MAG: NAD-dependent epimerase/dehydratase family protein [Anaerolineae bacterium]
MNSSGPLVLVTGANGFLGSHLTELLINRGYRVRCMVRRTSDLTHIRHLPVEWAFADVQDVQALYQACEGVDMVCHCAALTRARDEETFYRVNAEGTELLARACLDVSPGLKRFLFVSSQAVAGPSRTPEDVRDEKDEPQPITWYGRSKWAAEKVLWTIADRLPWVIVRPSAVFGPRDRDFLAYFVWVQRGLNLQLGKRSRRISLIYVRDLVRLLGLALESEAALGQTYFGCAYECSYLEFSAAVAKVLGKRTRCIRLPEWVLPLLAFQARVQGWFTSRPPLLNAQRILDLQQPSWLCSAEKARQELGFEPEYDLLTATQETADWYRENGWL